MSIESDRYDRHGKTEEEARVCAVQEVAEGLAARAWRDKSGGIRYVRHNGPEHVLCYAPTGSGKGVSLIDIDFSKD